MRKYKRFNSFLDQYCGKLVVGFVPYLCTEMLLLLCQGEGIIKE